MSEITGISGVQGHLINESGGPGNGLMPDIHEFKGNLEHVMVNNDIQLTPGKSMHCADDILSGVLEETLLSKYFFSDDNIKNIQKLIRYEFFKEKNDYIDNQSNIILLTIMRGIFLKYSNSADNTLDKVEELNKELNKIKDEIDIVFNKDIKTTWNEELDELLEYMKKHSK